MRPFGWSQAASVGDAVMLAGGAAGTKYLGGGTNLVDLMKMGVENPEHLVDISRLPFAQIEENNGGVRIGAGARNTAVAEHPLIKERYPLLSEAILAGASPQLRNMATTGGNLLQRTRCYYFYDPSYAECNKRNPGSGCAAIHGFNRIHAILGGSEQCIAVYPGDMAIALTALDAKIQVSGRQGERTIPIAEFYREPGTTPHIENSLRPGELITAVDLPAANGNSRSRYIKVRERNSYAFALVSVAAMVSKESDGRIGDARVALGGVGTKPWRVPKAEEILRGRVPETAAFEASANALLEGARPLQYNAFKVEMARRAIVRALEDTTGEA